MKAFIVGLLLAAVAFALSAESPRRSAVSNKGNEPIKQNVSLSAPVTVGTLGNEPVIAIAPDKTLYISALQHLYRSTDGGSTWTNLPGPTESQVTLASDSSLSVAPNNRLYFSFDYPYAGTTAVFTSDDKGETWSGNPAVVPGGTDRMWVVSPSNSAAYEVTNQGLYETTFLMSTDGGMTWLPKAIGSGILEPQTGPLLQKVCDTKVIQPIKVFGTTPSDVPELKLYVFDPTTTGSILSDIRPTGLGLPTALPSGAFSLDGVLYVCAEEPNAAGGRQVIVARSSDEGQTWTKLPPIPETATGTATFTWVAAGAPGHIGVIYYYTPDNGSNPGTMATSNWSVVWAESYNGNTASPTWTVTTLESLVHTGAICAAADCMGTDRFAGDFITAIIDEQLTAPPNAPAGSVTAGGASHLTWMKQDNGNGAISIRYQRIPTTGPSSFTPGNCSGVPPPVQLNTVVSRKSHGANAYDINLPVTGTHGIECRSGGTAGDYSIIFTFQNTLSSVGNATVSCGQVHDGAIGSDAHQYIVNLTDMGNCNGTHIFVTLHAVHDSLGNVSDSISAPMSLLIGDTNANGAVNSSDISQTKSQSGQPATGANFREDVTVTGDINSSDVSLVKSKSGTALP